MEAPIPPPLVTAMVLKLMMEGLVPFFSSGSAARVLKNQAVEIQRHYFAHKASLHLGNPLPAAQAAHVVH